MVHKQQHRSIGRVWTGSVTYKTFKTVKSYVAKQTLSDLSEEILLRSPVLKVIDAS